MKSLFIGKKRRVVLLLGLALLLLAGAAFGAWFLRQNEDKTTSPEVACNTDNLGTGIKENLSVLKPSDGATLQQFADQARAITGYEASANCMYILTAYQAYSGAYSEAKDSYARLSALNDQGVKIDESYGADAKENLDEYMKWQADLEKKYEEYTFRAVIPTE